MWAANFTPSSITVSPARLQLCEMKDFNERTHMRHWRTAVASRAHRPDGADMLFFLSGGAGSKAGALASAQHVAAILAAAELPLWYVDGELAVEYPSRQRGASSCAAENAPFLASASAQCANASECCPLCKYCW
jgi:hypothetical protein